MRDNILYPFSIRILILCVSSILYQFDVPSQKALQILVAIDKLIKSSRGSCQQNNMAGRTWALGNLIVMNTLESGNKIFLVSWNFFWLSDSGMTANYTGFQGHAGGLQLDMINTSLNMCAAYLKSRTLVYTTPVIICNSIPNGHSTVLHNVQLSSLVDCRYKQYETSDW